MSSTNVNFNVTSNRCLNCHLVLPVYYYALVKHKNDLVVIKAVDTTRNIEHGKVHLGWARRACDCRHAVEAKCRENSENGFVLVPVTGVNCTATVSDGAEEEVLGRGLGGEILGLVLWLCVVVIVGVLFVCFKIMQSHYKTV